MQHLFFDSGNLGGPIHNADIKINRELTFGPYNAQRALRVKIQLETGNVFLIRDFLLKM